MHCHVTEMSLILTSKGKGKTCVLSTQTTNNHSYCAAVCTQNMVYTVNPNKLTLLKIS